MSRLRTYARMNRQSAKTAAGESAFKAVYAEVDRRSEGRCEWRDEVVREFGDVRYRDLVTRCLKRAVDKHHTVKPRRSNHDPALIIALCRGHHERHDFPFPRGRAVTTALGGGRFRCEVLYSNPERAPSSVGRAGGHDQ